MNAFALLGGSTAAAGPLGGADASGPGSGSKPGAFEAFVARALQAPEKQGDSKKGDGDGDEDDAAGADLSWLLAMSGGLALAGLIAPVVDPMVASPAQPGAGGDLAVDAAKAAVDAKGIMIGVDSLPYTLRPAVDPAAFEQASLTAIATADALTAAGATPVDVAAALPGEVTPAATTSGATSLGATSTDATRTVTTISSATNPGATSAPTQPVTAEPSKVPEIVGQSGPVDGATTATPLTASVSIAAQQPTGEATATRSEPTASARTAPVGRTDVQADLQRVAQAGDAKAQAVSALQSALARPHGVDEQAATVAATSSTGNVVDGAGQASLFDQGRGGVSHAVSKGTSAANTLASGQPVLAAGQASAESSDAGTRGGSDSKGRPSTGFGIPDRARVESTSTVSPASSMTMDATGTAGRASSTVGSPEAAVAAPRTEADVHNVDTLVRSVRMQFADGGGEARLRLAPDHLGPLTLTVRVDQGRVSAHVQTQTNDASRWIESHQDELRGALREQGLDVKDFVVSTDPEGRRQGERPQEAFKARGRQRDRNGSTPTFEVLA